MESPSDNVVLMTVFQDNIYKLLSHFHDAENDVDDALLIQAAVLLKTAMELYAVCFADDDKIEKVLDGVKESIPGLRARLERTGHITNVSRTLH